MLVVQIIGGTIIFIVFFIAIGYILGMRIRRTSDNINNKNNFIKYKQVLNGEEENDGQLFFINKNDVTDVKLAYELISPQNAIDYNLINHDQFVIDPEDKYYEFKMINTKNGDKFSIYNKLDEENYNYYDYVIKYNELIQVQKDFDKKLNEFMQNSKLRDSDSLTLFYKAIIESKKINDEEAKYMIKTYFSMIDQLEKLNLINKNEIINEEINKTNKTFGFEQSKLKNELDQLLKK